MATLEQVRDARTALNVAQSNLDIAQFNLVHSQIIAPSDGRILKLLAEAGELIGPGYPALLFGTDGSSWIIKVGVTDRDVIRLAVGDSASFDNHDFILIAVLILIVLGTVSFFTMPKSEDLAVSIPPARRDGSPLAGDKSDSPPLAAPVVKDLVDLRPPLAAESFINETLKKTGYTEIAVEPNLGRSIKTASVRAVFIPLIFKFVFVYYDQFQFLHE